MSARRILFAGTPPFAAAALKALLEAGHDVPLVLTQPDRPAGRGLKLQPSAVKSVALAAGIELWQPTSLKDPALHIQLAAYEADLMIVAAYGLLLPAAVLKLPKAGCWNIHASLLPRWRGAAPIQRALLAGDGETGITIMQMDVGLDTGAMLLREALPILSTDTSEALHDKLMNLGAKLILEAVDNLENLSPVPQDNAQASYAAKISKAETTLHWQVPAVELERAVRAWSPNPGASVSLGGQRLKVWTADVLPEIKGRCGQVVRIDEQGPVVATAQGGLRLTTLQKAGGKRLSWREFSHGFELNVGQFFDFIED